MKSEYINTFTGETIIYNEQYHTYTTVDGKRLLGASSYAKQFGDEFPKEAIIYKLSKTWDMPIGDIDHMWRINSNISNCYGSAVHHAMEMWFRFNQKGVYIQGLRRMEHNYALPKNVHIRNIVLDFVSTFGTLNGIPEATLSAIEKGMAGRTDLIVITGEKSCRIADYKTNNELDDNKLLKYQHQLSFYADILTHHGWTVEGLDIYHHDGNGWKHIEMTVLPVVITAFGDTSDNDTSSVLSTTGRRPPAFKGV